MKTRLPALSAIVLVVAALLLPPKAASLTVPAPEPGGGQVPSSIRKPAEPAVTEAKREAQCKELKLILSGLKDPVWLKQPHSDREVKDLERQRATLNCGDASAPLAGTWQITGTPSSGVLPMSGKMDLSVEKWETGRKLGLEEWGIASSNSCRDRGTEPIPDSQTFFYYSGSIKWDEKSFYDASFMYWIDKASPLLVCTTSPESTQATGNFRDDHGHGGFIQLHVAGSTLSGFIVPESSERGGTQNFTGTRVVEKK